jgi:hypothetical protein
MPKSPSLSCSSFADEDVEWSEIAMQGLSPMQRVECAEYCGDLASNEPLGLRALAREPRAQVTVYRVLQRDAVARALPSTSTNRSRTLSARRSRKSSSAK